MDLFVFEELAHLHEEDLILVLRPLKDGLPEEERVAWSLSVCERERESGDVPSRSFSRVALTKLPTERSSGSRAQPPIGN